MRDQDSGNCLDIKNKLLEKIKISGKENFCLVRIACHELENFYLGDLDAVAKAMKIDSIADNKNKRKFRNPDTITNAPEILGQLTCKKYKKVSDSISIGQYLKLDGSNRSRSFGALLDAIRRQAYHINQKQGQS